MAEPHRTFDEYRVELYDLADVEPGANAEDCPHCDHAAMPYPWICPGHTAHRP